MAASRLSIHVSRETEHDGDSIGADGPVQRYTRAAGRPLHRARCRAAAWNVRVTLQPGHERCRLDTEVSMRLCAKDRSRDSDLFRTVCGLSHGETGYQDQATDRQPAISHRAPVVSRGESRQ
jgi:hypothetical protein